MRFVCDVMLIVTAMLNRQIVCCPFLCAGLCVSMLSSPKLTITV